MEAIIEGLKVIIENIWSSVLGMDIEEKDLAEISYPAGTIYLTGAVEFTEGWEGAVIICCPLGLATTISANMFGCNPSSVTPDDIKDAIGEIANITAGNIKPLFPDAASQTMPSVIEGTDYKMTYRGCKMVGELHFECEGDPVSIQLFERIG